MQGHPAECDLKWRCLYANQLSVLWQGSFFFLPESFSCLRDRLVSPVIEDVPDRICRKRLYSDICLLRVVLHCNGDNSCKKIAGWFCWSRFEGEKEFHRTCNWLACRDIFCERAVLYCIAGIGNSNLLGRHHSRQKFLWEGETKVSRRYHAPDLHWVVLGRFGNEPDWEA